MSARTEIDDSFAEQVADFLYRAGKSRADTVVLNDGIISFKEWVLRSLIKRDAALSAAGFAIVPTEPTEEMLAAVLPLAAKDPSYDDKRLGARACMLLSGPLVVPNEGSAVIAAAQLAQDYRALVASAPKTLTPCHFGNSDDPR